MTTITLGVTLMDKTLPLANDYIYFEKSATIHLKGLNIVDTQNEYNFYYILKDGISPNFHEIDSEKVNGIYVIKSPSSINVPFGIGVAFQFVPNDKESSVKAILDYVVSMQ